MVQKVLYIHGYGSNGNTETAKNLRAALGPDFDVVSPSYDGSSPGTAAFMLQATCLKSFPNKPIVVGTSLGGFFANYLSRALHLSGVIINPSLHPSTSLQKYGESADTLDTYAALEAAEQRFISSPSRIVILGTQDDILDHAKNGLMLEHEAEVILVPMGHRVDPAHIETVADAVRKLAARQAALTA